MIKTMPEWAPQSAIIISWPHGDTDWQHNLDAVTRCYCEITHAISHRQPVIIICYDEDHRQQIHHTLNESACQLSNIHYCITPTNDTWVRDYGPITVQDLQGKCRLLNFTFNGWGDKFPHHFDNLSTEALIKQLEIGCPVTTINDFVLEGGSIEMDGEGTLLTTSQCLLNPNRNPNLMKAQIESTLKSTLGVQRILWLDHGHLEGDDTDSHVDTLARFCGPTTICYTACDDPDDPHYPDLNAMEQQLQDFRTLGGEPYHLIPLPWPQAIYNAEDQRLPASYANFLIINGAVLVPIYNDPADILACQQIQSAFPTRGIVPIDARPLIEQSGMIHCLSMQLPAGVVDF